MAQTAEPSGSRWGRLAWLILIWTANIAALGVLAWVIRLLMAAAGLTRE